VHDEWSIGPGLKEDARFQDDYVPLFEELNQNQTKVAGRQVYDGSYVRRELIQDAPGGMRPFEHS
jgi:hypothetical protein